MNPRCKINDAACNPNPHIGRGLCMTHYSRLMKWGDPFYESRDPVRRFWAKVEKTDTCWIWTGSRSRGYGTFNCGVGRGYEYAHRFSYRLSGRDIPQGLELDHLCRTPACVNPDHLEPVSGPENIRRAARIGHHPNAPKTCKRGHDWSVTPPYLAHRADGRVTRRCRLCQSDRDKARRATTERAA